MSSISIPKKSDKFIAMVFSNIQSNLIEITEDKLENTIIKFIDKFSKTNSWLTPFSIMVSIIFSLLTSEVNKSLFGISKEIWNAIFYLAFIISFFWLGFGIINHFRYRSESKVDVLISKIKNITV